MTYQNILIHTEGRVGVVQLNRPKALNALNRELMTELMDALGEFDRDPAIGCMVVTGSARAFAAGADIKEMAAATPTTMMTNSFIDLWDRLRAVGKPIIAAVSGFALGGGCELAMACDMIVATQDATFGLPEARVGVVASGGGPHRLTRQLPLNIALGMLLTGKPITAAQAHNWGMVNEVVPTRADLLPAAERWAAAIVECAPLSVRATKQAALMGLDIPLDDAINRDYPIYRRARYSEDFVNGPRAFAAKEKPVWKGR